MSKFQIITFSVIGVIILIALFTFMGAIPSPKGSTQKFVEFKLWGTIQQEGFNKFVDLVSSKNQKIFKINYIKKDSEKYENELANAFLTGNAPDMWMITQDMIWDHRNKVELIPYKSLSYKDFTDTFIEEAELLLIKEGIIGIPILTDPMVLYWNRDIFSSSGIAQPPKYWDEVVSYVPRLTKIDSAGNIYQSGISMGEFRNVNNAKEIISMLVLQKMNRLADPEKKSMVWDKNEISGASDIEDAVRFYTEFSDSKKQIYSWNRSLKNSLDKFTNGSLAMYFGFSSEALDIQEKNPHLNFGIVSVPQIRPKEGAIGANITFGRMHSIVFSKMSPNKLSAFNTVSKMQDKELLEQFADSYFLMPATRELLNEGPLEKDKPYLDIFYQSALQSHAWLEPKPEKVSEIFKDMIESVSSGEKKIPEAVYTATYKLNELLLK